MKKVIGLIMIFSVLLLAGNSYAQERIGKKEKLTIEQRAQKKADHMQESLTLDDGQKEAVYQIILEQEKEREAERMKRKARAERVDSAFEDVLTPDQMARHKELRTKRKDAVMKRHKMMKHKARGSCCEKTH